MPRCMLVTALAALALAFAPHARAQSTPPPRVGVVFEGGSSYLEMLEGFKSGLRELGLEEGRNYALEIHDVHGDLRAVAEAARAVPLHPAQHGVRRDGALAAFIRASAWWVPPPRRAWDSRG